MTDRTGHEPGEPASNRLIIPLAPGQRAMFQDRRARRCLPVYGIPGVSSSTVAAIENGTGRHHIATLARFAGALGLDPGTLCDAGLPGPAGVLAHRLEAEAGTGSSPDAGLPPASLTGKIRRGVTARTASSDSAWAVAQDLIREVPAADLEALWKFMQDVASLICRQHYRRARGDR